MSAQFKAFQLLLKYTRVTGLTAVVIKERKGGIDVVISRMWKFYQIIMLSTIVAVNYFITYEDRIKGTKVWNLMAIFRALDISSYSTAMFFIFLSLLAQDRKFRQIIEDTLRYTKKIKEPVWKNYHNYITLQIAFFSGFPVVFLSGYRFFLDQPITPVTFVPYVYSYNLVILTGFTMLYSNILYAWREKLKIINYEIEHAFIVHKKGDQTTTNAITALLQASEKAWKRCLEINSICGVGNIMVIGLTFGEFLYSTADTLFKRHISLESWVWCSYLLTKTLINGVVADATIEEAKKTPLLALLTSVKCDDPQLREKISAFGLSRMHSEYKFHACGMININMRLFSSLVGATIAYGVVIHQFLSNGSPMTLGSGRNNSLP